ncbi:hypothetical protein VIGAN_10039500, partial [Vigna angularis var. angularis]
SARSFIQRRNQVSFSLSEKPETTSSTLQQPRPSHRGRTLYPVQLSVVDAIQAAAGHRPRIRPSPSRFEDSSPREGLPPPHTHQHFFKSTPRTRPRRRQQASLYRICIGMCLCAYEYECDN